jgi:hypothetical protein
MSSEESKRNALGLGLCSHVHFLFPISIHCPALRIHPTPPCPDHLEREIACSTDPRPPQTPAMTWEERKGNDALVLVTPEELTLDPPALDVGLEPCERLGKMRLSRVAKMRSLCRACAGAWNESGAQNAKVREKNGLGRARLTSGASMAAKRMWIVLPRSSAVVLMLSGKVNHVA